MFILRLCVMVATLLQAASAMDLYANADNSSYALVLCGSLDQSMAELRRRELTEHAVGAAWLEQDCVSIDVCQQVSSNRDPVSGQLMPALAGTWLNVNSSALQFQHGARRRADAEAGKVADNVAALEFARVPEGLKVETCAVDYDLLRRTGIIACEQATLLQVTTDYTVRSCPGDMSFSLVDCVKAMQFDAGSQNLMRRPEQEQAHFGTKTRAEACAGLDSGTESSALVAQLCLDLEQYLLEVPKAAIHGTTSLVRYEFLDGYGCLGHEALAGSADTVLSRRAAPNRVVSCPSVLHGQAVRRDAHTCGIDCDAGFRFESGACVSNCAGLNATCAAGFYAVQTCVEGSQTLYRCEACLAMAGHGAAAWRVQDPQECQYEVCAAGRYSAGLTCVECGVNTFSNASGAEACMSCETLTTGLYQRRTGQTACEACLWKQPGAETCDPGAGAASNWQALEEAFASYNAHGHQVELQNFYEDYCSEGHACLQCVPGYASPDYGSACEACAHGFYQPNIGMTMCHQCAAAQNTSSVASTLASDCVCNPGHQ